MGVDAEVLGMGATNREGVQTTLAEDLELDFENAVEYDNFSQPVRLRDRGTSFVQTIPVGATRLLDVEDGSTPRVFLHPTANAITFVYDDS